MMRQIYLAYIAVLLFTLNSNSGPGISENTFIKIDSIYDMTKENPNGRWDAILFDTKEHRRNILVKDTNSVLTLIDKTQDLQWALVSVMPANADEARGTNERPEIYYVPLKVKIDCKSIMNMSGCTWIAFYQKDKIPAVIVSCGENMDTLLLKNIIKKIQESAKK